MKSSAILVLAFATAVAAGAQRTGAHAGAALRSAPVAHAAPVFRGGMAPAAAFQRSMRPLMPIARAYPAYPAAAPHFSAPSSLRRATIAPSAAPSFYHRNNTYRSTRRDRGLAVIGYPTSVVGVLPYGDLYDDSYNDLSYPSEPTALQQPDYGYDQYQNSNPGYPDYGAEYAQYPPPGEPAPIAEVPSTPESPESVTLIFNNGQPPEQIQNFLATRTTLTVIDGTRRRDIPIAELDVPATVKANRADGIDFSLPTSAP